MFSATWKLMKETVLAFIDDEALSRGAAIAFYTVTSIAPVLLIVIAIAGLVFGSFHDDAPGLGDEGRWLSGKGRKRVRRTATCSRRRSRTRAMRSRASST
jgi:hypothetical protein